MTSQLSPHLQGLMIRADEKTEPLITLLPLLEMRVNEQWVWGGERSVLSQAKHVYAGLSAVCEAWFVP